jgi:hypothetical protein
MSVIRMNTIYGDNDIIEYGPEHWEFSAATGYDIAVVPLPIKTSVHRYSLIPISGFVTTEKAAAAKIGPGDDVFMVGRFVDHDGGATNVPAVRFGNISSMPAPIKQATGKSANCYCIDMHSRSGYSGSPVFVYRTPGFDLEQIAQRKSDGGLSILTAGVNFFGLLGIHFGQFPELWEISGKKKQTSEAAAPGLIVEGQYIKGLSGMTCVLPASSILEVLQMPKLKALRDRADDAWEAKARREGFPPVAESAPPTKADSPSHKKAFNRLLGAAVKKKPQAD